MTTTMLIKLIMAATSRQGRKVLFWIVMGIVLIGFILFMFLATIIAAIVLIFNGEFYYPMPGHTYISSSFSPARVHPSSGIIEAHNGTDFPAPTGTPVLAPRGGTVFQVYENSQEGKTIVLYHENSTYTRYKHLDEQLVEVGDIITMGQMIGYCGSTGDSTGPHLHFEIIISGEYIDAETLLKPWPEGVLEEAEKKGVLV